ncbi:Histidine acid phosphatase family protein [Paraburkholderia atlantica]|uniref:Histidine acid phosphatase family protein n=1 Tax=Paraburkholderia atlantica TaxID=2654982 RepID=D5WEJ2_PARAM|nr:Histidine acid phosphatase family protein [Paraburkholderia atlantica]
MEARFRFLAAFNKAYPAPLSFDPLNRRESRLHSFRPRNIPHGCGPMQQARR